MDDYRELVDECFRESLSKPIDNSSPDHAAVLLEKMFEYGNKTIHIFAGSLADYVYGRKEMVRAVKGFLERKGKLQIILHENLKDDEIAQKQFIAEIKGFGKLCKQVEVYRLTDEAVRSNIAIHFAVMDEKGLRVETDLDNKIAAADANTSEAVRYERIFSKLLEKSKPVDIGFVNAAA